MDLRRVTLPWLSPALGQALRSAAVAFVFSRLVVYAAAVFGPLLLPERIYPDLPDVAFHTGLPEPIDALVRWDAIHYLAIARDGYHIGQSPWDTNVPFLPLYPWAMRLLGGWAGDGGLVLAGLLLSNLAFLATLALLHHLVARDLGPAAARRTVLYLAIFPTAYVFSAVYTESLFLLLTLAFFIALRGQQWAVAGALGGLAALTRLPGALLIFPFFWGYLGAGGGHGSRNASLFAVGLVPLGTLVYMGALWLQVGDPFFFRHTTGLWGAPQAAPLGQLGATVAALTQDGGRLPGFGLLYPGFLAGLFLVAGLRLPGLLPKAIRLWYWVYVLCVVGLSFASAAPFYSFARFLLPAFPGFVVFGVWGKSAAFHYTYLLLSLVLLALSTALFVQWYWVA